MIPILYKPTETDFEHNGIGHLVDCISCTVTENRNGSYEAEFVYSITGQLYSEIAEDYIVKLKPNETSQLQLFRIYKSSKPFNGKVTFYCEHISYILSGIPIEHVSFDSLKCQPALAKLFSGSLIDHNFSYYSDIETYGSCTFENISIRNALGGTEGSILDTFGGEFEFDNFTVKLLKSRGSDTGIRITYGKNLTDVTQEKNISETYTAVYPYATYADEDNEEVTVTLSEKIIYSDNADLYAHQRVYIKDCTELFGDDETITEASLRSKVKLWMSTSGFDEPSVNITVSFKSLWDSPEYEKYALLERVSLCDKVTVYYEKLGISATAKVIKTVYDVLGERYTSIELGDAAANLADNLNGISDEVSSQIQNQEVSQTLKLNAAISKATAAITGQSGGHVVLNPSYNPEEILILDTDDISTAENVWRWNSGGFGHSSTGYNGEYDTAITMDGLIVADFIGTGTLNAAQIDVINLSADSITSGTIDGSRLTIANIDTTKVTFSGDSWITGADVDETLEETLKEYSTTTEIETMFEVSEGNILLEVSEKYVTTTTLENYPTDEDLSEALSSYVETDEIRSRFAMDSSSITIESGVISFDSNSISINSDNFKLTTSGEVSATGSFTSGSDSSYKVELDAGGIAGYYLGSEVGRISMDAYHYWTISGAGSTYRGVTIESGDVLLKGTLVDINTDYLNISYSDSNYYYGSTGTIAIPTALYYETLSNVAQNLAVSIVTLDGNSAFLPTWTTCNITYCYGAAWTYLQFEKGLLVTYLP